MGFSELTVKTREEMISKFLTNYGEKRIQPDEVREGGILTAIGLQRHRQGVRVHYKKCSRTGELKGRGWMILSDWAKLKISHKTREIA